MRKIINSPIFITVIVLSSLFAYHQYNKNMVASEIRGIYEELLSISEDAKDDLEKKKIIKGFISEGINQVKEAFSEASASKNGEPNFEDKQRIENQLFFQTKGNIAFSQPGIIEDKKYNNLKYVYELTNNSLEYVGSLKHTITFYKEGSIVNAEEEWGNIKLAPNEKKVYSKSIHGTKDFDEIKINLNDLTILKMPKK